MKRKNIFAFCFNLFLIISEVIALIFMIVDNPHPSTFKYFTGDSNIVLLIAVAISFSYDCLLLKNKIKQMPKWVDVVKLVATTAVTVTMFVTVFFLTPTFIINKPQDTKVLYLGANLIHHIVCPVLAIITYVLFENRKDIKIVNTIYGLVPTLIYGIYYLIMAYTTSNADWYGLCAYGTIATVFILIGLLGFNYLFSWLLWLGNKKINVIK